MILTIGNMSLDIDKAHFERAPFPADRIRNLLQVNGKPDAIGLFAHRFGFDTKVMQKWLSGEEKALANNALRLLFIEAYLAQEREEI